jgi:hypothetical protein
MNELSKKYQLMDDEQKFDESKRLMQEKLKEVSSDYLGLNISNMDLLEGYYPFQNATYWEKRFDLESSSVCGFEGIIPLHMQIISKTDNFQIFAKKYSSYHLELIIMDERNTISNIHYGLTATNSKNQSASTSFHLDSCTNEITDKEPYHLSCFDQNNDHRYATFNTDDILSSFSNTSFCKMELDPWRQSLQDYSKILSEKRRQLHTESMDKIVDQESQWKFFSEMNKQGELGNLVGSMVHGKFDGKVVQEKIRQYEKQYGSLPDELLELIEKRK